MSDERVIEILTDRHFETNEEELMHVLGWEGIVNLWRVYEEREELEEDRKLRRKFGIEEAKR